MDRSTHGLQIRASKLRSQVPLAETAEALLESGEYANRADVAKRLGVTRAAVTTAIRRDSVGGMG